MELRLPLVDYFDARGALEAGLALADRVAAGWVERTPRPTGRPDQTSIETLLRRATADVNARGLNFYKRARLANRFRWRLLERGVDGELAEVATERLVLELAARRAAGSELSAGLDPSRLRTGRRAAVRRDAASQRQLRALGDRELRRGSADRAIAVYEEALARDPGDLAARHNLAAACIQVGRHHDALALLRSVIAAAPEHVDARLNLGTLLRWMGEFADSEAQLRRAVMLKPKHGAARIGLAATLVLRGRLDAARTELEAGMRLQPRSAEGLCTLGQIEQFEGRFEAASAAFERAQRLDPECVTALVGQAGVRRMTHADAEWLQTAGRLCAAPQAPLQAASLHFAMGKYYDDVRDFDAAFGHYRQANELLRTAAAAYDRSARVREVDATIRRYGRARLRSVAGSRDEPASATLPERAAFVVGMMRSGTSLAEQILASHPAVHGAGELGFWSLAALELAGDDAAGPPDREARRRLAAGYAQVLGDCSEGAARVVDKAPINADHLGLIHAVLPGARIIHLTRDPLDTCLSCYFQQFSVGQNFSMDLGDLAHYYRQHTRLMAHWRAVLPAGTLLEVPYAGLVGDTETWARRMIAFLGLEWDPRCLDFHLTRRPVVTASSWQVRQPAYVDSLDRWRHYRKFLGPLLELRDLP